MWQKAEPGNSRPARACDRKTSRARTERITAIAPSVIITPRASVAAVTVLATA
jgi:hypothetical protein